MVKIGTRVGVGLVPGQTNHLVIQISDRFVRANTGLLAMDREILPSEMSEVDIANSSSEMFRMEFGQVDALCGQLETLMVEIQACYNKNCLISNIINQYDKSNV